MTYFLTHEDVRDICYEYARAHLTHDEPIPSFEQRYADRLDAVLAAPQVQLAGSYMHHTLARQAAVLFYEMIKQHPFMNGNKRIACVAMFAFLTLNGAWLNTSWRALYDIAVAVATSHTANRDGMLQLLTDFLQNHIEA